MRSIRYSPVLQALPPERLAWLMTYASQQELRADERIALAAEPLDRVHLVDQGVVKLIDRDQRLRESILTLLVPGDLLGEIEALDDLPALFEAAAATPCRLISFERAPFVEATSSSARASLEIARAIASRTRTIATNSMERYGAEARVRIAARLLDLAELLGHMNGGTIELEMPITQEELGHLSGMCRESACRTLRKFRAEGILEQRGRKLRILKPDVLEHIRCGTTPAPALLDKDPRRDRTTSGHGNR